LQWFRLIYIFSIFSQDFINQLIGSTHDMGNPKRHNKFNYVKPDSSVIMLPQYRALTGKNQRKLIHLKTLWFWWAPRMWAFPHPPLTARPWIFTPGLCVSGSLWNVICQMHFVSLSVAVPIMISQTPCLMSKCHRHAGEFVKIL